MRFRDRSDAGRQLAGRLVHLRDRDPVVLALPRGGVPVGFEVARELGAPLDLVLVRKIGVPWQPELAMGAVTDGDDPEIFIDRALTAELGISEDDINRETAREIEELERRRRVYRLGRAPLEVAGRTAIVVDDGIATGATMRVALQATRRRNPAWLVLATPVAAPDTIARLRSEADEVACVEMPSGLGAIGSYYTDFHQVSDQEVIALLARAAKVRKAATPADASTRTKSKAP
jgi:putative phosphoribosyl transferase